MSNITFNLSTTGCSTSLTSILSSGYGVNEKTLGNPVWSVLGTKDINGVTCEVCKCPSLNGNDYPAAKLYISKSGYLSTSILKPIIKLSLFNYGNGTEYPLAPSYKEKKYWLKYGSICFYVYEEESVEKNVYTNVSVNINKTFDRYENVSLSCTGTIYEEKITLSTAGVTVNSENSVSISDFSTFNSYFNFSLKSATENIEKGTLLSSINKFEYPGTYLFIPESTIVTIYTLSISINDYSNEEYVIKHMTSTNEKVYVGQQISDNFLNSHQLILKRWNDYNEENIIIDSSLDISKMSKTIWFSSDTKIEFDYTYNESTIHYDCSNELIDLAEGNNKFSSLYIKSNYVVGDELNLNEIDISSGNLLYSDGSSISISEISVGNPRIVCSLDENENSFILNGEETPFTISITIETTYFGVLTYDLNCFVVSEGEDFITSVILNNEKKSFNKGEILTLGEVTSLLCLNSDGELVKEISYNEFNRYITEYPAAYNKSIGDSMCIDKTHTLTLTFLNYLTFSWEFVVDYNEKSLTLDTTNVQTIYYYENSFELNTNNLKIYLTSHKNSEEIGKTIVNEITTDTCTFFHNEINVENGSNTYVISVAYVDSNNQESSATYSIDVIKYKVNKIVITGTSDNTTYWDNENDKFRFPSGLQFYKEYTNGDREELTSDELLNLLFYRDEALIERLVFSNSIIKKSDGNTIYVKDPSTSATGKYYISFKADNITNIYLANTSKVDFVLGNSFTSIRNNLDIYAAFESGITGEIEEYTIVNNGLILEAANLTIKYNDISYNIETSDIINFIKPEIESITVDTSKFNTSYTNKIDEINCNNLQVNVKYKDSSYIHSCKFSNSSALSSSNDFIVTCDKLTNFNFDGSQTVDIDMGESVIVNSQLNITVQNFYDSSKTSSTSIDFSIIEITEIVGINLKKAYTNYVVGDEFLNENDDTVVTIYYKENNVIKKMDIPLNSNFSGLNIYPIRSTKFTKITNSRTVRITSSTNSNVICEYDISVSSKYNADNVTDKHELSVVYYEDSYLLPNGKSIEGHYLIVDKENTYINTSGERVLKSDLTISNVKVYGYLEDIFDENKNARVILFDDYVPCIQGESNITVKFPCYVKGNADKINKCSFGILFGNNNAKNRLFVSGNNDIPNCDWHTGQIDSTHVDDEGMLNGNFGYFEDTSYCYYGETDNKIIGYDIISNDKLLVLKTKSDKETTVYFRTPTLIAAIDGSGNSITGIDNKTLYQEEYSLSKGNNSVGCINSHSVVNFNGDSLFISDEKSLVGLDITGILGDNQRYANSRSLYIDKELRSLDMSNVWVWTNNKYLFIVHPDKIYATHYETLSERQYEWWILDIKNIQSIIEINNKLYFANSYGQIFVQTDQFEDISKIFIGQGGSLLVSEGDNDNTVILNSEVVEKMQDGTEYTFKIIASSNDDKEYMFYRLGNVDHEKKGTIDFYVNKQFNCLEMCALVNGETDYDRQQSLRSILNLDKEIYLNQNEGENEISTLPNSVLGTYYKRYKLKRFNDDSLILSHECYKLYDLDDNEMDLSGLLRCTLCYRLDDEYKITNLSRENSTLQLQVNNEIIDLVRYCNQTINNQFKAELKQYSAVQSYFITKPFTMGSLNYMKTIWQWTLTNDPSMENELEVAFVGSKNPILEEQKEFVNTSMLKYFPINIRPKVVPQTYTNQYLLSNIDFICFGFRNIKNTNSILSSLSIVYTIPYMNYSGK